MHGELTNKINVGIKNNLTFVIVAYESDKVIHGCLSSIPRSYPIIIIENSGKKNFQKEIEKKYPNVKCEIMEKNEGYGFGNNLGIKLSKTRLVFILNPDVRLQNDTLEELDKVSNEIKNFAILAPTLINLAPTLKNNELKEGFDLTKNYGLYKKTLNTTSEFFETDYAQGCALLLDKDELKDIGFFDENIFLYLEDIDLCKRVKNLGKKIYVSKEAKIEHLGAKAVNDKFFNEVEFSRNWHWMWSTFYFNKKHYGYFFALKKMYKKLITSMVKFLFFTLTFNSIKKKIYLMRFLGLYNSIIGKKSWYRAKIK
jgi:GT2 family glycosyltransferase